MEERLLKGHKEHGGQNIDTSLYKLCNELRQETTDVMFYVREMNQLLLPQDGQPQRVFILPTTYDNGFLSKIMQFLYLGGHYPILPPSYYAKYCDKILEKDNYNELDDMMLKTSHCVLSIYKQDIKLPDNKNGCNLLSQATDKYALPIYSKFEELPLLNETYKSWSKILETLKVK